METRANYILVGFFTLTALVGAFGFVYWLLRFGDQTQKDEIAIVIGGSVSGLNVGSPVLFNGIRIGDVTSMALDERNPRIVRVRVKVQAGLPLKVDTKASLDFQGLTGGGTIQFLGGTLEAAPLIPAPGIVPEIVAGGGSFQDLMDGARQALGQANSVFARIDSLVEQNQGPLGETIANARDLTQNLKDSSQRIGEVIDSVQSFAATFKEISGKVDGLVDNLNRVVSAVDGETIAASVKNVELFTGALAGNAGRIDDIAKGAAELVAKMNGVAARVDGVIGKVDGMVEGEDGKGLIAEATEAARSFRKLSADLEQRVATIGGNLERFSGNGLRNIETLISDGRRTLATFDRVVSNLERNPGQFLLGGGRSQEYSPRR